MSEQNIVNISEANLQQTLQQSMNVPVLFYFWSARSQHCEQLTPVLERGSPIQRPVHAGEGRLRRRADARFTVWSARHPYGLSVPERPAGGWF